jgi:hypothetical protein
MLLFSTPERDARFLPTGIPSGSELQRGTQAYLPIVFKPIWFFQLARAELPQKLQLQAQ